MEQLENQDVTNSSKQLFSAVLFPFLFLLVVWAIKFVEITYGVSLSNWGLKPRELSGLPGIILSPFIHGDMNHLISNSFPLFLLATGLIYFYRVISYEVILWIWAISGLWVWIIGRDAYHIGSSNLIYGFAAFLFFSGAIRKHPRLLALSLLVIFLYGSMIWGIFPVHHGISWEAHLFGLAAGGITAYFFRHKGPQSPDKHTDEEEDINDDKEEKGGLKIIYHAK